MIKETIESVAIQMEQSYVRISNIIGRKDWKDREVRESFKSHLTELVDKVTADYEADAKMHIKDFKAEEAKLQAEIDKAVGLLSRSSDNNNWCEFCSASVSFKRKHRVDCELGDFLDTHKGGE